MKVGNKLTFSKSELMNWLTFKKHKMSIKYVPREKYDESDDSRTGQSVSLRQR